MQHSWEGLNLKQLIFWTVPLTDTSFLTDLYFGGVLCFAVASGQEQQSQPRIRTILFPLLCLPYSLMMHAKAYISNSYPTERLLAILLVQFKYLQLVTQMTSQQVQKSPETHHDRR